MPEFDIARLAKAVRAKRGERSLREIASEVQVSYSTLSRVEGGNPPDVYNLTLIFDWLNANPADYFILNPERDQDALSVQLRAMQGMSAETARALMDVVRAVYGQVLEQSRTHDAV